MQAATLPSKAPVVADSGKTARLLRRADAYRLLSAALYAPCEEWREEKLFESIAAVLRELYPNTGDLGRDLESVYASADTKELVIEASRLFIGPFELLVPLYGSCHLEENRQVMGDSTVAVQKFYREWGIELSSDAKEMPDHLAVELEFLHFLLHEQATAINAGDDKAASSARQAHADFFERFLFPFARSVTKQLKAASGHKFYVALADLLDLFIQEEEAVLRQAGA